MAKQKTKITRKTKAEKLPKQPKIIAISAFPDNGSSQCFGLGADGKLYGWRGLQPAHWVLQEFAPPSADEIAARLAAIQEEANKKPMQAPEPAKDQPNRHQRRALKAVVGADTAAFE